MAKDFTATINTDSERAADWLEVFGDRTIYLKSPLPSVANLPGLGEKEIYELDIGLLTSEQRNRLVTHISQRFQIDATEVEEKLDEMGCPILAEDIFVTVHNPQKWF